MFDSFKGRTCLHYAAYYGHSHCLQAILTYARSSPVSVSWFVPCLSCSTNLLSNYFHDFKLGLFMDLNSGDMRGSWMFEMEEEPPHYTWQLDKDMIVAFASYWTMDLLFVWQLVDTGNYGSRRSFRMWKMELWEVFWFSRANILLMSRSML